ncbi:hypothetical protein [Actinomadura sp. KC216]|uniref:hypothetical protein n=1 Tax=Actinomadura sp. KC216 TaxID=2530370 RepID=UPI0014055FB6|nr:hypothetical protein [Actinomadura sp. KC216]
MFGVAILAAVFSARGGYGTLAGALVALLIPRPDRACRTAGTGRYDRRRRSVTRRKYAAIE